MKKMFLCVLSMFTLLSCEQNVFDLSYDDQKSTFLSGTRAVNSVADFDPISQLADVPVNIKNVGNTSYNFLSCAANGTKVDLYSKDDGSLRQRWYVNARNIFLVGGNSSVKVPAGGRVGVAYPFPDCSYPFLAGILYPYSGNHSFVQSGNYYYIQNSPPGPGMENLGEFGKYLQPSSKGSSALSYKTTNSGDLSLWEIVPVGEYEIVDLEYVLTSVDNLIPNEVICARDEYQNLSTSTVTWDYSLVTKYSESSNFSRAEGVSVSLTGGFHVGLPNLLGNSGILDFNTSIQQQSNKSWTYGKSETKDVTETRTGHIPVPANTTVRLEIAVVQYKGNMTYVATLRKIGGGTSFKIKGKWTGTSFSMFKAKTYNVSTNAFIGEYLLE